MGIAKFDGGAQVVNGVLALDPNQAKPISTPLPRACLIQEALAIYPLLLTDFFVWDSGQPLPATAATDDLTVAPGTWGTGCPALSSGDCKNATTTRYARTVISLPAEYDPGETITLRLSA